MALIFILLYAPIVTLVVLSFNDSKTRAKWGGFTLHWYRSLFANTEIMNALYTTLIIALLASAIATILGTLACIGINSMSKKSRTLFMGITNIPMLNGEIVMGISLMLLFIICRIQLGFGTILMAHITFNVPYVILSVMPKLKQTILYAGLIEFYVGFLRLLGNPLAEQLHNLREIITGHHFAVFCK